MNYSRQSVNQETRKNFSNLRIWFHKKRVSATPNNDYKIWESTFEENDKEDVDNNSSQNKMEVRKWEATEGKVPLKDDKIEEIQWNIEDFQVEYIVRNKELECDLDSKIFIFICLF